MPIHDWTRVDAGLYHHFHQVWSVELCAALNEGRLPGGYLALTDQRAGGPIPDVLTLHRRRPENAERSNPAGGLAVAEIPPQARFIDEADEATFPFRANRIAIQHRHGEVVAIIEIISPGNKSSDNALQSFLRKSGELIDHGVNLLVVDPFPPTVRDPQGIHAAIWDYVAGRSFRPPDDKPLTVAAYKARPTLTCYAEPLAVGDELPSAPIFLNEDEYVPAPLEVSYQAAWARFPAELRPLLLEPNTLGETAP